MAWHLIKSGGDGMQHGKDYKEFLLDSEDDIDTEPEDFGKIAVGSVAYTCESGGTAMNYMYMKCSDGTWAEM